MRQLWTQIIAICVASLMPSGVFAGLTFDQTSCRCR
jgi:hypothetical protein